MADVRNIPPAVRRAAPSPEFAEVSDGFELSKTEDEFNMRSPKWVALFKKGQNVDRSVGSTDASRDGTAKPPTATGSGFVDDGPGTDTGIASRDDDESFPFPPNIRHRHSEDDGAPQPCGSRKFESFDYVEEFRLHSHAPGL